MLNESRRSARGLAHFSPYSLNFRERDILSGYIAIQHELVQRIAELDFNVVHLFRKRWVADQQKNEIIQPSNENIRPSKETIRTFTPWISRTT